MSSNDLANIIDKTFLVLTIAIIARALITWVPNLIDPRGAIAEFLFTITEPILAPIRSVMPRMGMFDFTPMIAIILLQVIRGILISVITG
ncbi:MAG TPA: YggT family protein [Dehalococcoidia bacterium]|nr:YggT family protein [Dehalococcoidia bacterium]